MALDKATLLALIDSDITDNNNGEIDGPVLNNVLKQMIDSTYNKIDEVNLTEFAEYDPTKIYNPNNTQVGVMYNGALYQAKTGVTNITGAFNPAQWNNRSFVGIDPGSASRLSYDSATGLLSLTALGITDVTTGAEADLATWIAANYTVGNELQEGDVLILTTSSEAYIHNGGVAGTAADFTLIETPGLSDSEVRALFDALGTGGLSYNPATGDFTLNVFDGANPGSVPASTTTTGSQLLADNGWTAKSSINLSDFNNDLTLVSDFTDLGDTPANYTGSANYFVRVNATPNALEFVSAGSINVSSFNNDAGYLTSLAFTDLTDTPSAYTSQALKVVRVNAGETGLEFVTIATGNIYTTDGTVGAGRVVTLTDNINFSSGNFGIDTTPAAKMHLRGGVDTLATGLLIDPADVTGDGGLNASPVITLRAKYDSDPTAGITSANSDMTIGHRVTTGGASPYSYLYMGPAGVAHFVLSNAGDVGIGNQLANAKFEVYGNSGQLPVYVRSSGTNNAGVRIKHDVGNETDYLEIFQSDSTGGTFEVRENYIWSHNTRGLRLGVGTTYDEKLLIAPNGVGVNFANSASYNDISAALHARGNGTTSGTFSAKFQTSSGTDVLVIRDDGRVAINNASPGSYRLYINAGTLNGQYITSSLSSGNVLDINHTGAGGNAINVTSTANGSLGLVITKSGNGSGIDLRHSGTDANRVGAYVEMNGNNGGRAFVADQDPANTASFVGFEAALEGSNGVGLDLRFLGTGHTGIRIQDDDGNSQFISGTMADPTLVSAVDNTLNTIDISRQASTNKYTGTFFRLNDHENNTGDIVDILHGGSSLFKIGPGTIGFFAATPVVQQNGTGETVGFTAGAGTGVNDDSTFTGNVGATAYRISDVVKALKNYGLLAS